MDERGLKEILNILDNWKEVKNQIEEEERCLWNEIQEGINFFGKLTGKSRKNVKIPDFSFMPKCNVKVESSMFIQSPKSSKPKRKAAEVACVSIQELARKNLHEKLRQPSVNKDANATVVIKKVCTDEPRASKLNLDPIVLLERNQNIPSIKKEASVEEEKEDCHSDKEPKTSRLSNRAAAPSSQRTSKRTSSQRLTETKEVPNKKRRTDVSSSSEQLNDENEDPKKMEEQEDNKPSIPSDDIRRSQRILKHTNEKTSLDSSISPPKLKVKENIQPRTTNKKVASCLGNKKLCTPVKPKIPLSANKVNSALKKIQMLQAEQRKKEEEALRKKLKEQEALKKKEELIKNKKEHLRRKNEDKALKVTATREAIEKEKREELEKMEKEKEERERHLREEIEKAKEAKLLKKKQMNIQKAQEVEERRLKEEAARLAKLKEQEEEQRRQEELRIKQQEHAERLQQQRKMEEEMRQKELASKIKEPKKEIIDVDDYGIDNDIKMDEEEETITKPIPEWAKRANRLKELKYQQAITQEELTKFFAIPTKTPNLKEFFGKYAIKRVRTSSAVWSPK
ncbi:inner centromere protein-like [Cimex lectularius]|uniref:Inner centromere protein ARK-binding domain-containing protein n=1 Tax=Cimex lectularius TaxID=79782 RepID=A0A8I6RLS6_CIMLE|nr:inner centromere protein-like [Cimex lectularius]